VIALLSPWPPSVATGSGTTVSQNRLAEALTLAGLPVELLYSSRFAASAAGVDQRRAFNEALALDAFEAVLGIDGEGWLWAAGPRRSRYVAFCEAVLAEVLPFEEGPVREVLAVQAQWEASASLKARR
jgi:hypothetical protein